jgi:hypothetical protein
MEKQAKATKTFRQFALLFSLVCGMGTVIILASGAPECEGANLSFAMFVIFAIYGGIFTLLLI